MDSRYKIQAAEAALLLVEEGMALGLGSGSTAEEFIKLLARRVGEGLTVTAVPTSEQTRRLAQKLRIPLSSLDETPVLDLTVDGADEIGPHLQLIKGGGGAHLREKMLAYASKRLVIIADHSKQVEGLGAFPLPLEVVQFGLSATKRAIEALCKPKFGLQGAITMRMRDGAPFITDGGNFILDASFGRISRPKELAEALKTVPGLVEHGLFINSAHMAYVAGPRGVSVLQAERSNEN